MKQEGDHSQEIELIRSILQDENYRDFEFFKAGGTRNIYISRWGPAGELRVIKIDKEPSSKRLKGYQSRGYNTRNDVSTLAHIKDPEKHNLMRLSDCKTRNGVTVLVEPFFESESLEDIVRGNPLKKGEFEAVFSRALHAVQYLSDEGVYHRDLKPSNILVSRKDGIDVRLTDFANACKKEDAVEKAMPTLGGHLIADPLMIGDLTGKISKYNDSTEIYAMGMDMLFALTGEIPVEYSLDSDIKKAVICSTGESLLDKDGRIMTEKHDKAIEDCIKKIPRWAKKYKAMIRRSLTLDESKRYHSIDNFVADFNKSNRPGRLSRMLRTPLTYAAAALMAVTAAVAIPAGTSLFAQQKEKPAAEAPSKYEVVTGWDDSALEVHSNLVDLELNIHSSDPYKLIYGKDGTGKMIEPSCLELKKGEKLTMVPAPIARPRPSDRGLWLPCLRGKAYFEGWAGTEFATDVLTLKTPDYEGGPYLPWVNFVVPKDMPDGNYSLVIELYAHDKPDEPNTITALSEIKYTNPGRVLASRRIPAVVGKPKDRIKISGVGLDYSDHIFVQTISENLERISPNLDYDISIPEMGFRKRFSDRKINSNTFSLFGILPRLPDEKEVTLQIAVSEDNRLVGYFAVPIKGRIISGKQIWPDFAVPGPQFSDRIVDYRTRVMAELAQQEKEAQERLLGNQAVQRAR